MNTQVSQVAASEMERQQDGPRYVASTPVASGQLEESTSQRVTEEDTMAFIRTNGLLDPLPKTMIMFHTDAYLRIFPYCKAVLDLHKIQAEGHEEYFLETVGVYVPAVTIAELDAIASQPGKESYKQIAVATLRMIRRALHEKNPYLEAQGCCTLDELRHPIGTTLKDDRIYTAAELLSSRGAEVVIVTDEAFYQSKFALMSLPWISTVDFIARFHWLTPTVQENLVESLHDIGEVALLEFAETVATSIIWKTVIALLAPIPMSSRLAIFSPKPLTGVLDNIIFYRKYGKYQQPLFDQFFNIDDLTETRTLLADFHKMPSGLERTGAFVSFLESATRVCKDIQEFFCNMQDRVSLLDALRVHLRTLLEAGAERSYHRPHAESSEVFHTASSTTSKE